MKECQQICMLRLVKVDGRVRTDPNFPCGFNDVISLDKTDEHFRMMFDVKGRYVLQRLNDKKFADESSFKLCRVNKLALGAKGIPYVSTHDGRTIRYPDPLVRVHDVIKVDLATGKMTDIITFETGTMAVVTKGKNNVALESSPPATSTLVDSTLSMSATPRAATSPPVYEHLLYRQEGRVCHDLHP